MNKEDWSLINEWIDAVLMGLPKLGLKTIQELGGIFCMGHVIELGGTSCMGHVIKLGGTSCMGYVIVIVSRCFIICDVVVILKLPRSLFPSFPLPWSVR